MCKRYKRQIESSWAGLMVLIRASGSHRSKAALDGFLDASQATVERHVAGSCCTKGNAPVIAQEFQLWTASYVPTMANLWRRRFCFDHRASEGFIYILGAARPASGRQLAPLGPISGSRRPKNKLIFKSVIRRTISKTKTRHPVGRCLALLTRKCVEVLWLASGFSADRFAAATAGGGQGGRPA